MRSIDISKPVLEEILGLVYKHTGITMTEKKKTLLQGRLGPRLKELSLSSYSDYVSYFLAHPEEAQEFINLVTTNETLFFRTPLIWDYFTKAFLPAWWKANPGKTLRIWSAAASTGEEAYTIAMVCRAFQEFQPAFLFQINGTDISTEVLGHAQKGVFSGRTYEDLQARHPAFAAKYFSAVGDEGYQAKAELRAAVRFGTHNLLAAPPARGYYDIVFLRNVLIYFNSADQAKVLSQVGSAVADGGTLVLGESESLSRFETPFTFVEPLIYRKKAG